MKKRRGIIKYIAVTAVIFAAVFAAVSAWGCVKERSVKYLFIGDSYAARLESQGYQSENLTIFAIPGYTVAQIYECRDDFPEPVYDRIVLMAGINTIDVMEGGIQIDDEVELIMYLREFYNTTIYVQKVFPVGEALLATHENLTVENVAEYNRLLEEYCDSVDGVVFFDATEGFVDENGYLTCTDDYLHIAGDYLDEYFENVMKAIREASRWY